MKARASFVVLVALAGCVLDAEPGQQGPRGETGETGTAGVSPFAYTDGRMDIYYTAGRLGLGTMTPLHPLDVHAIAADGAVARFEHPGASAYVRFKATGYGGSEWQVGADTDAGMKKGFAIYDVTSAANRMIIDESGNVGIGTIFPEKKLTVRSALPADAVTVRVENVSPLGGAGFHAIVPDDGQGAFLALETKGMPGWILETHPADNDLHIYRMGLSESIRVNGKSGNVGIGTTTPTAKLHVVGPVYVEGSIHATGNIVSDSSCCGSGSSDARLKQNIVPLTPPLSHLLRLRGVTYKWRDPTKHSNLTGPQIGMIAQEVEQVFPEWVGADADGYKTLTYRGFEALTVESLRELKTENDHLKAKAERFETQNAALTTKLSSLEERIAALEKRSGTHHASVFGDVRWFGGAMFGAAVVLVPWWVRRRRRAEAA